MAKKTKLQYFTVIGLCEEQRHAFHVQARNADEAEKKCLKDHDRETSYHLVVAGVLKGRHRCVEENDSGTDQQMRLVPG